MNEEEKKLLLIDLCGREPYHPRINVFNFNQGYKGFRNGEFDTNLWLDHIDAFRFDRIEILPYLRPMSSMTFEERSFFLKRGTIGYDENDKIIDVYSFGLEKTMEVIDFLNAHHFDWRGLIKKGLALEAHKGMYDIK